MIDPGMLRSLLARLVLAWGQLDVLKVPAQGNQESAGKPPARRSSSPPVVMDVLAVDVEITAQAREVFSNVAVDLQVVLPPGGVPEWCAWAMGRLDQVLELPWVDDFADQVLEWVMWVKQAAGDQREVGSPREVARWCVEAGVPVTAADVAELANLALVAEHDDGLVSFGEVLAHLRAQQSRSAR